jgi:hypothetical protein
MTYEKPEIFVLSLAGGAVRNTDNSADTGKHASTKEGNTNADANGGVGGDMTETSTTSGAYEADE